MRRVLLTGAGGAAARGVALSISDANRYETKETPTKYGIYGVDTDPYKLQRSWTNLIHTGRILIKGKNLIDELNEVIEKFDIDFVHAQPWRDVLEISARRGELKAKTFLPRHQTVLTCTDKYSSYLAWNSSGIKVPNTKILDYRQDLRNMLNLFEKCWIRAREGAGGLGAIPVTDENWRLAEEWVQLHGGWHSFLVSEYLGPRSVTWMSLWNEGKLIVAQGRERLYWEGGSKFLSGVSGVTGAAKTVSDPTVDKIALRSIKAVDKKPHGIFSVDLTYDKDGVPNPTEINIGKFFTTVNFFTHFGLNMPEMYLDLAFGDKVEPKGINPLPPSLVQIRGVDIEPVYTTVEKLGVSS